MKIKHLLEERMKSFFHLEGGAHAVVADYYGMGYMINLIYVPEKYRGQGLGRQLLKQIIAEADRTNNNLYLEILSTGEMDYEDLEKWYLRYGFKRWGGIYRRKYAS